MAPVVQSIAELIRWSYAEQLKKMPTLNNCMYEGKSKIMCTLIVTSTYVDKFSKKTYCETFV